MKETNLYQLITVLQNNEKMLSSNQLAELLNMSVSTLKKELMSINKVLIPQGAKIIGKSGKGNGYSLEIKYPDVFNEYLNIYLAKYTDLINRDLSIQDNRVQIIIDKLLSTDNWIKSEELCDSLYISLSQFNKDLIQVKNYFKHYDIELLSKPYYGFKIEGEERQIRHAIANLDTDIFKKTHLRQWRTIDLEIIESLVKEVCNRFGYKLSEFILSNLVIHLFIVYSRVISEHTIQLNNESIEDIKKWKVFPLAVSILSAIQNHYNITFDDNEAYYIAIHLNAKRIVENENSEINSISLKIVDRMFDEILREYGFDLSNDLNLRVLLAMHITPLIERIKYKMDLKNPLLQDIKKNYLISYDIAVTCAKLLNEIYHCKLSEDEIGYFALYIQVALFHDRKKESKNILLVCSTGRGSAQLLKHEFLLKYKSTINSLETCDIIQFPELDLSIYDAIFTTVPIDELSVDVNIPIFLIDTLKELDDSKLGELLIVDSEKASIIEYFPKKLFLGVLDAEDKNDVIHEICRKIRDVIDLPDGFENAVFQREEMSDTNFGTNVAFPHPIMVISDKTFISVGVLKKPIQWGTKTKVRLVLLASFDKGFVRNNTKVIEIISSLITNKKYSNMLIASPTYETLVSILSE